MFQSTKEFIKEFIDSKTLNVAILLITISFPLLVLINRFIHFTNMDYYYWDKTFCILGQAGLITGLIYFIVNIKNIKIKDKSNIPYILLILFMLWSFITCFYADNPYQAFNGTAYRQEGFYMYLAYSGFLISAIISQKENNIIYKYLIFTATIISLANLYTIYYDKYIFTSGYTNSAIFYNPNHFGYFLVIPLIFSINYFITEKKWYFKILYLIAYIPILSMLIQTNTTGAYLASIVSILFIIIYYAIIKHKWISTALITAIFIVISLNTNIGNKPDKNIFKEVTSTYEQASSIVTQDKDIIVSMLKPSVDEETTNKTETQKREEWKVLNYGNGRLKLWINSINLIKEKPILGYGIENISNSQLGGGGGRPHNLILQLCLFVGIPGAILYLTAMAILILRKLIILSKLEPDVFISLSACIGYLISAMFGNSMFYTSPYFFIALGNLFIHNRSSINN